MKKINFYMLIIVLMTTVSCMKDPMKNLFDLRDVNETMVALPKIFTRVYLSDTVVRVEPQISQTLMENESNLSFAWKYSSGPRQSVFTARNQPDVYSTDKHVDLVIRTTDKVFSHYFWLEVIDHTTGISYPAYTEVVVIKPFFTAWTLLHSVAGSPARLGAIEYMASGEHQRYHDVHATFGHAPLTGTPLLLGPNSRNWASDTINYPTIDPPRSNSSVYLITTNPTESGVFAPWKFFRPLIGGAFFPQMIYNYSPDYFDISKTTYVHKNHADGGAAVNDGRLFVIRNGLKWYEVPVHPNLGEIRIDHVLQVGNITLMFDGLNRQFLYHNVARGGADQEVGSFNPDVENVLPIQSMHRPEVNLDADSVLIPLINIPHNVLHIGVGARVPPSSTVWSRVRSYAIANGNDGKTYIYLFPVAFNITSHSSNPTVEELRVINTPPGLDENSRFASSVAYHHITFFSSGSSVYRLDFHTGEATKIYEHSSGGEITVMRMARQEPDVLTNYNIESYGHPIDRSIGLAINKNGSGELVVLNLTTAGLVLSTMVYDGFGTITDLHFVCDAD
jgi:hypothetical protein